ncbi:hypothetical protein [Hasllibacter sp. MH4015]|uniref:hypothetical protein n=1 Tax=Hasllibacter sp. MH4015 TaxID=2854029 RepID=UPI001CD3BB2F|nr:hypothetical protein [Hasllibacter sp. MH4015]
MRIAILQTGGVHEEIVPSLIEAIGPDARVAVWLNAKCRATRGDIFAEIPGLGAQVHDVRLEGQADWDALAREVHAFAPEIILVATFQRQGVAEFVAQFGKPVLGVIHNVPMALKSPLIATMIADGRCRPLTLAPHVAAHFHRSTKGAYIDRVGVVEPVHWGSPAQAQGRRLIAIPGGVNATNRDFDGLMAALADGLADDLAARDMALAILGGGPDRARLEAEVGRAGWQDIVRFAPLGPNGRVLYDAYLGTLRRAWALLPLIPLSKADYREFKITSAIPTAIGFGLPLPLDRWTSAVYRCPHIPALPDAAGSLRALVNLTETSHGALSDDIARSRQAALTRNRAEMARLLPLPP